MLKYQKGLGGAEISLDDCICDVARSLGIRVVE
jgi:hypothetical protein